MRVDYISKFLYFDVFTSFEHVVAQFGILRQGDFFEVDAILEHLVSDGSDAGWNGNVLNGLALPKGTVADAGDGVWNHYTGEVQSVVEQSAFNLGEAFRKYHALQIDATRKSVLP